MMKIYEYFPETFLNTMSILYSMKDVSFDGAPQMFEVRFSGRRVKTFLPGQVLKFGIVYQERIRIIKILYIIEIFQ